MIAFEIFFVFLCEGVVRRWDCDGEMGNCGGKCEENKTKVRSIAVPSPHRAIAEENEENFKGIHLGKKRLLESTLRSGLPVLIVLIRTRKHCFKTWKDTFVFRDTRVNY